MLARRLVRCRSAQKPPVMRTSDRAIGQVDSRAVAVGRTGPATRAGSEPAWAPAAGEAGGLDGVVTETSDGKVTKAVSETLRCAGDPVRFASWSEAWGRQATTDLLQAAPDLDAVFCGSDQIARGVLDALREGGRAVPDDVAVIGFDNWSAMIEGSRPALSTVDLDIETIGRLAARHLVSAIKGDRPPRRTVVTPRLVLRDSA
jgi:ABC-type xylose transport system substrate-binding protein